MFTDVRVALRMIGHRWLVYSGLTLALSLGCACTILLFAVDDAILFRPLRVPSPERMVEVTFGLQMNEGRSVPPCTAKDVAALADRWPAFTALAGLEEPSRCAVEMSGSSHSVVCARVTPQFFSVAGVAFTRGRPFSDKDPDTPVPVVVTQGLADRLGNRALDTQSLRLQTGGMTTKPKWVSLRVVGTVPADFHLPGDTEMWLPLEATTFGAARVWGRLGHGGTLIAAKTQIAASVGDIVLPLPGRVRPEVRRLRETIVPRGAALGAVLLGASVGLLVIAWLQVLLMLAVRYATGKSDLFVRLALGASVWRLVRQHIVEAIILSGSSCGLGLISAYAALPFVVDLLPFAAHQRVELTPTSVAFAGGVASVVVVVFGAVVAWSVKREAHRMAFSGHRSLTSTRRSGAGHLAAAISTGAATAFAYTAAVLALEFVRAYSLNPGFDRSNLMAMTVLPSQELVSGTGATDSVARAKEGLVSALERQNGVKAVTVATGVPFGVWQLVSDVSGQEASGGIRSVTAVRRSIGPGYFSALGVRLVLGREFQRGIDAGDDPVIVSELLAGAVWGRASPVGRVLTVDGRQHTVIGVCGDFLDERLSVPAGPRVYTLDPNGADILVRAESARVADRVFKAAIAEAEQTFRGGRVFSYTYTDRYWQWTAPERMRAVLMSLMAIGALGIALLGVACHALHWVTLHRRTVGIVAALGAPVGRTFGHLFGPLYRCAVYGVAGGVVVGIMAGRAMRVLLPAAPAFQPAALLASVTIVAMGLLVASAAPALRLRRTDIAELLRRDS